MNKALLIGHLGKDVELQTTQNGKVVGKFSLAVFEGSGDNKKTTWFNIVLWDKIAEHCKKHLSKGKKVAVAGRINVRQYEDKNGNNRTAVEIIAEHVEFLSPKTDNKEVEMVPLTKEEEYELPF